MHWCVCAHLSTLTLPCFLFLLLCSIDNIGWELTRISWARFARFSLACRHYRQSLCMSTVCVDSLSMCVGSLCVGPKAVTSYLQVLCTRSPTELKMISEAYMVNHRSNSNLFFFPIVCLLMLKSSFLLFSASTRRIWHLVFIPTWVAICSRSPAPFPSVLKMQI